MGKVSWSLRARLIVVKLAVIVWALVLYNTAHAMSEKPDVARLAASAAQGSASAASGSAVNAARSASAAHGSANESGASAGESKAAATESKQYRDGAKKSAAEAAASALRAEKAAKAAAQTKAAATGKTTATPEANTAYPGSLASLQPFQHFARGAGEGVAYEYKPRTKAQFVALLRDRNLAKKEMRVTCDVLIRQMVEANKSLPFEGCEGAAAAIERNADFSVVDCQDPVFQRDYWLSVTNGGGSAFGVWHRGCLPREQVLVYKGQPVVDLMCLNVPFPVVPLSPQVSPQPGVTAKQSPPTTAGCPNGIALYANAWTMDSMPPELRAKVQAEIDRATDRDSKNASDITAYEANDVSGGNPGRALSGNVGDELIRVVNVRAPLGISITVQLLNPVTLAVDENLGSYPLVDGVARIALKPEQRLKIVQTIWPAWFVSPTVSGGLRRILLLPRSWEKPGGGRWCSLQENAAYWERNRR